MTDGESVDLVRRVRQGDEQAASELFDRFVSRLIGLARSRLPAKLARRVDPEDVVQSAYRSFFAHARNGDYQLRESGDLWRLLAAITINKVRYQTRRHTAGKRTVRVEDSNLMNSSLMGLSPESLSKEPLPEEAAVLTEGIAEVVSHLSPLKREIAELRLQGHTIEEVALHAKCTERTVQRTLKQLKDRLEQSLLQGTG